MCAVVQVFLLEGENRKLTRALVREVGDDTPLAKVLSDEAGSEWRGRREQIAALKNAVRQLKEAAASRDAGGGGGNGGAAGGSTSASGPAAKHEAAHRSVIGRLNKAKDAELQRMAAELEAATAAAEQLRLQYTGACSRRKVLEAEVCASAAHAAVCPVPAGGRRHRQALQPNSMPPPAAVPQMQGACCAPQMQQHTPCCLGAHTGCRPQRQAVSSAGQDTDRRQAHQGPAR